MKTNLYSKIWLTLLICLIQTLYGQNKTDKNTPAETTSSKKIRLQLGVKHSTTTGTSQVKQKALTYDFEKQTEATQENKKTSVKEVENLSPVAIRFQIDTYENTGLDNRERFKNNLAEIKTLLATQVITQTMNKRVTELIIDSERNLKLATEMREEAHAETQPAIIAGRLSNADEKETMALSEQKEVLHILDKHKTPVLTSR